MRVLVLGASGMLGSAVYAAFAKDPRYETSGSVRNRSAAKLLPQSKTSRVISGLDVLNYADLKAAIASINPDLVINCIGVIKQIAAAKDPLSCIAINALLPHQLSALCASHDARLIQISTDCVFSGQRGHYVETDTSDATDLYGRTKLLGEVLVGDVLTLRTSIIGHEFNQGGNGLIGWFLSQTGQVSGFKKAIFSGLPTVVLARTIKDLVAPNVNLRGLYHVSSKAIDKFELLTLVKEIYGTRIEIVPSNELVIDRSLVSTKFCDATGFVPPSWRDMILEMHQTADFWNWASN